MMALFRVVVTAKDQTAATDLVRKYKLTVARHSVERLRRGFRVSAHATLTQIRTLEARGYRVRQYENVDAMGKLRQAEVRAAFIAAAGVPTAAPGAAAAAADRYLTTAEIEAALDSTASAHPAITQLIKLPNPTWEQRTCRAIRIAAPSAQAGIGIYFLGGVHAREWGSPDILIHFIGLLTEAYAAHKGIKIGPKTFSAAQIKKVVDTKQIFVFPQANPDGRLYSMTKDSMWRKNRRPATAAKPKCAGVDINRNYEFLWNYPAHFDPSAPIANSVNACDETYIGPNAFSEPETRNAAWMFDHFPAIRYFIDIHSYSEAILFTWGDDDDQTTDPSMNFRNAAYDGKRGIPNDTQYKEFVDPADRTAIVQLAGKLRDAIQAVRGRSYKVEQSVGLYPTAGTSDDYAFSRWIVDKSNPKVYSYTIEWGRKTNPTPFHPAFPEMRGIIDEVTVGLIEFCIRAS